MRATLSVTFNEHISSERVRDMVSGIAAYGNVFPGTTSRDFLVEVFRASNLPGLKKRLAELERHGFLHWTDSSTQVNI
jgi:hypothetical protein